MPGPICTPTRKQYTRHHVLPVNRALDVFSLCDEGFDSISAILFYLRKQLDRDSTEYHLATAAMSLLNMYSDLLQSEAERSLLEVREVR